MTTTSQTDFPVTDAEFAASMDDLGPWGGGRPVAVAVSGGADSLCLALLASRWGDVRALVVDHCLRSTSAVEAQTAIKTLSSFGVPARLLRLDDLKYGPGIAERARDARYQALLAACAEEGLTDLLLGHHAGDQAETVLMRREHGSGPDGLAGMSPLAIRGPCRLLRPLLGVTTQRLRATLNAAGLGWVGEPGNTSGLGWVEDPSNHNPKALRTRMRQRLATSGETQEMLDLAARAGAERQQREAGTAETLARVASLRPEGFALLQPGPWKPEVLSAVLRMVGGLAYPVEASRVAAVAQSPRAATLGGVRLLPAGRLGDGWLVVREVQAMEPTVPAAPGVVWDKRFRVTARAPDLEGLTIGALLDHGNKVAKDDHNLPAAVRWPLPAFRRGSDLVAVPHLGYCAPGESLEAWRQTVVFEPPQPAASAPFKPHLLRKSPAL